ncbi:hypothetical protein GobsT_19370 [Gemmata obscuriglobus]|uniref:TIGR03066 family protein n=1 Tax=Gemmata obscuriglobus TaxID=114 RepID=A0A2Z3H814_9BACT|nr:TIGR03066 family protein [Gemmata obscuriglobus]AWM39706.1 TIGR03066 family protein [Gemmata obscuriglobus]QEG27183.1 hypothetical protein GobsT_19370 [Gemmata obscuriglobus]VTS03847.1 unnamed protein product [Gemmata obscuriglobus UQM 2246]
MAARWAMVVAAVAFGGWGRADEPKKAEDVKTAVVGKWETADKDRVPLEIRADGTIGVPFRSENGKWVMADGTYTVDAAGKVTYKAASGGSTLGGWYQYKDGGLVSAMGPKNRVTWKRVEKK